MPTVGRGLNKTRIYHHNGSLAAFLSCVHLLPDTQSAIVVLTNAIAKNDCADWLAQLILETFLDSPEKNDYLKIAEESAASSINNWKSMEQQLSQNRTLGTVPSTSTLAYVGKYYNNARDWFLEVFLNPNGQLMMCFQGDRRETYVLDHYNYDVYSWVQSWDDTAKRGRFRNPSSDFYLLRFIVEEDTVTGLKWTIDGDLPEGQLFAKSREHNNAIRPVLGKGEL